MQDGLVTLANRIGDFLNVTLDGYAIFSADDVLIGCNQAFATFMCVEFDQLVGLNFNQLYRISFANQQGPNIETNDIEQWLKSAQTKRRSKEFRLFEVDHTDGSWYLISEQTLPSGELLLQAKNISSQKRLEQNLCESIHKITSMALTDELTQIANRRSFIGKVKSEINLYQRNKQDFTFCLLDIDYFKNINDQFGHQVGDSVLLQLCNLIKIMLREYDHFGRIGGEEFGILLRDTLIQEAQLITNRLREKIKQSAFNTSDSPVNISISVGLVESSPDCSFELLYSQADTALYQAKNLGRNQVVAVKNNQTITDSSKPQ